MRSSFVHAAVATLLLTAMVTAAPQTTPTTSWTLSAPVTTTTEAIPGGGIADGAGCVAHGTDGNGNKVLYYYVRGTGGAAAQLWLNTGTLGANHTVTWSQAWKGLGGTSSSSPAGGGLKSPPSCMTFSGSPHVLVRGLDDQLWHYRNGAWKLAVKGTMNSAPSCVSSRLQTSCYARDANNALMGTYFDGHDGWSSWASLDGGVIFDGDPSCAAPGEGDVQCFVKGNSSTGGTNAAQIWSYDVFPFSEPGWGRCGLADLQGSVSAVDGVGWGAPGLFAINPATSTVMFSSGSGNIDNHCGYATWHVLTGVATTVTPVTAVENASGPTDFFYLDAKNAPHHGTFQAPSN